MNDGAIVKPIKTSTIIYTRTFVIPLIEFASVYHLYNSVYVYNIQRHNNTSADIRAVFAIGILSSSTSTTEEKVFAITFLVNTFGIIAHSPCLC